MRPDNVEAFYPLSPLQEGLLFHSLAEPKSGMYFNQCIFTLRGNVKVRLLKRAWQQVVDRHAVLRTFFLWEGLKAPIQVVDRQIETPFEQHDLREISPVAQQARLESMLRAQRVRGFDLSTAPLMRLDLVQTEADSYEFIWSHHHILLDGWSMFSILKELFAFYEALNRNQELKLEIPRPYRDYIAWLKGQDLTRAETFWRKTLQGFTAATPLGTDNGDRGSPTEVDDSDTQQLELSALTLDALKSLAQRHHVTLNTLVQMAWSLLLSRYTGEEDVVFGIVVSGRPAALTGFESMVGLFINTLPVRVQLSPQDSLVDALKQMQRQLAELREYEYSPLVSVHRWSDVPPSSYLFESILLFENYRKEAPLEAMGGALEIHNIRWFERTNYPLTVIAIPEKGLLIRILYHCKRFEARSIQRMLGHLKTLLEGMVAGPNSRLGDLPMLTPVEGRQLLVEWVDTKTDCPHDCCIHQLFEAQVERAPDAVAVVFEDRELSYRELNARANQLAHHLQTLGVGPETLIGICMDRSLGMVVGLLAILKAGGAYVPLDPAYPKDRLGYMLHDSAASVLLIQAGLVAELPEHQAKIVHLDADWSPMARSSNGNPKSCVSSENVAYVIYTSGSTGKPKGVQVLHRGVVNFLNAMHRRPGLTAADTLVAVTTLSFDIAALELLLPLTVGARVVLASRDVASDGRRLKECLAHSRATAMQATPATWRMLLETGWQGGRELKRLCGGEALSRELANQLLEPGAPLWNMYGPTETTIWSAVQKVEQGEGSVAIGRPIDNTQIYLLDRNLQLVPIGVYGELHIGGAGLARGYLNRPELTAENFIPDPFSNAPGARLYKTGDLARYLPQGTIDCVGRLDHQVKIRGFRVEPGEIEAVCTQHSAVDEVVVAVREDEPVSSSTALKTGKRLVAYIVSKAKQPPTVSDLRKFLKKKLPDYMVPSTFVFLDALPLTPNGKVNRRALPAPEWIRPELEMAFAAPKTKAEQTIARVWQEVLGIEQVGLHDNFFDLGGHSLLLMHAYSKLRPVFDKEISMVDMFKFPTVSAMAAHLLEENGKQGSFVQSDDRATRRRESMQWRKQLR